jgi:esterase/lipase superfamily enzyme
LNRPIAQATLVTILLLAACASRPETGFLTPIGYTGTSSIDHSILVATTRQRGARPGTYFNGEREDHLNYAKFAIAVPQDHVSGEIDKPLRAPGNPKTDFVVEEAGYLDGEKEFIRTLHAELSKRPEGDRKVLLFIHGYNTMFAEGLYRSRRSSTIRRRPQYPYSSPGLHAGR